jgi:uncharacterized protein (TIGR02271 family)
MTIDYVQDLRDLIDRKAVDPDGDKIGTVSGVYLDDETGEPNWLAVTTGWFGTNVSFVPFAGSYVGGDDVVVAYPKGTVKDAPNCEADGHLTPEEEARLYEHYRLDSGGTGTARTGGVPSARGGASGRTDDAMTRSEEELDVSKRRTETGRARLRKWVETEHVQMTVPIRREKARLVTEPIDDRNRDEALAGPDLTESEHEVVLTEEEIDIDKRVVPKERVRLEKDVETEEVPVDESVRKERIEMDRDAR